MLPVSFICFLPHRWANVGPTMIRENPSSSFRLHFCVYLLLYAGLRLLHLKVVQILYTLHVLCFCIYTVYIYIYTAQIFTNLFYWIHPSVWQLWLLVLLPIVRSQRQIIFKHTVVCTYSLVFGLSLPCFYSLVHSRLWWTEHSGLKYTCGTRLLLST